MKIYFSLGYLLSLDFLTREQLGRALQSEKTKNSTAFAILIFVIFGVFICASIFYTYLAISIGVLFGAGLIFGIATGSYHSLPIRPWYYITCLDAGVWIRVKRKIKCPCKKSCLYCKNMHECEEMFIIYPKASMTFFNLLQKSSAAAGQ